MIRPERPGDEEQIHALTAQAFAPMPYSDGAEPHIIDRLRAAGALTLSLVTENSYSIIAHIAFSPVTINGKDLGWLGLGPVSVAPDHQRSGLGTALIREGLSKIREGGAKGCVLLGSPDYYRRFGFRADDRLRYLGPPSEYFQQLTFEEPTPMGIVAYHAAFGD